MNATLSFSENTETKQQRDTTRSSNRTGSRNAEQKQFGPSPSSSNRRKKSPGIRVHHGRIYHSEMGKSCHQVNGYDRQNELDKRPHWAWAAPSRPTPWTGENLPPFLGHNEQYEWCRQKTLDFVVSCENEINSRRCTLHFCHTCLLHRYGEKAEEMAEFGGWKCPRCRGICNCSLCMKKRGSCPTGKLVHVVKASGFSSAFQMLMSTNSKEFGEDAGESSEKEIASKEEDAVALSRKHRMENVLERESFSKSEHENSFGDEKHENPETKRLRKNDSSKDTENIPKDEGASPEKLTSPVNVKNTILFYSCKYIFFLFLLFVNLYDFEQELARGCNGANLSDGESYPKLPRGIQLTHVANIELPAEDIGHALQFLEFCEAFAEVLDLKKGQSTFLLQEVACGPNSCRESFIVQFHMKLLSIIEEDSGKGCSFFRTETRKSWLQALYKCISKSPCRSRELLLDCLNLAAEGYGELSSSKKLRLLSFLCDEALSTAELRSWIDEQDSDLAEREKVRNMKLKLQDELARDILMKNDVPQTVSEHRNLVLKIKAEAAQHFAGTSEAKDAVMEKNQRSYAVRLEPILLDGNGRKFWKLRGYSDKHDILIQVVENGDSVAFKERWFSCNVDEIEAIENYISSSENEQKKSSISCQRLIHTAT
ncbi:hypothetical protein Vadar_021056 [Vaccinium darrowii]|uniref:Uncharacterized protein n=1 Tax=Vaccinium darrowii TaxID=229202 RepID=A0ACB7YY15_9ERIC|nr:hypothetical protein Vadar_021056 [Vaccinium darrowii]